MGMTDEEKMAALQVPYEPEEGEKAYLVVESKDGVHKIVGVFTEEQVDQAYALSNVTPERNVLVIPANKALEEAIVL